MPILIKPLTDLELQESKLGCSFPGSVCVFPKNFDTAESAEELVYDDSAQTLKKLLKRAGIDGDGLKLPKNSYLQLRSDLPAICLFAGWTVISQDPTSVQLALGVVSNYLTDLCKGYKRTKEQVCEVKVIREKVTNSKRSFEEITYSGPVEGLKELMDVLTNE